MDKPHFWAYGRNPEPLVLDKQEMFDYLLKAYQNWVGHDEGTEENLILFAKRCKELK